MPKDTMTYTPGLEFPEWDFVTSAEHQAAKLACCGVDPALYGDRLDITVLALATILSAKQAGISINGSVHMAQFFDMREPVMLGEALTVRGEVMEMVKEPRGHVVASRFDFARADGSVPVRAARSSLVLDPAVGAKPSGKKKPGSDGDPRDGMALIATHQLIPEQVAAYSDEADNLIHSDPKTAQAFGFRAPIAAGLIAVRFMMAALCDPTPPDRLKIRIRFRRPMFWDEKMELWARRSAAGPIEAISLINPDGKLASEAVVEEVGYSAGR